MKTVKERFLDKIEMEPNSGCWLWTATCTHRGYGQFTWWPKKWQAHRWSAKYLGGMEIEGKIVRHLCHTRSCVNPDHLATGTQKDNMKDCIDAGRTARGTDNAAAKINEDIVRELRARTGESVVALGREFGISHTNVGLIQRYKSWKWLT